jgi:hypothetical protein
MAKVYVYVDGFNLYYGALKSTPYRWLNISALCAAMLPGDQIAAIRYFTATVSARPQAGGGLAILSPLRSGPARKPPAVLGSERVLRCFRHK